MGYSVHFSSLYPTTLYAIVYVSAYSNFNFKAVLALPKTASFAQTHRGYHLNCLEHSICISLVGPFEKKRIASWNAVLTLTLRTFLEFSRPIPQYFSTGPKAALGRASSAQHCAAQWAGTMYLFENVKIHKRIHTGSPPLTLFSNNTVF